MNLLLPLVAQRAGEIDACTILFPCTNVCPSKNFCWYLCSPRLLAHPPAPTARTRRGRRGLVQARKRLLVIPTRLHEYLAHGGLLGFLPLALPQGGQRPRRLHHVGERDQGTLNRRHPSHERNVGIDGHGHLHHHDGAPSRVTCGPPIPTDRRDAARACRECTPAASPRSALIHE